MLSFNLTQGDGGYHGLFFWPAKTLNSATKWLKLVVDQSLIALIFATTNKLSPYRWWDRVTAKLEEVDREWLHIKYATTFVLIPNPFPAPAVLYVHGNYVCMTCEV